MLCSEPFRCSGSEAGEFISGEYAKARALHADVFQSISLICRQDVCLQMAYRPRSRAEPGLALAEKDRKLNQQHLMSSRYSCGLVARCPRHRFPSSWNPRQISHFQALGTMASREGNRRSPSWLLRLRSFLRFAWLPSFPELEAKSIQPCLLGLDVHSRSSTSYLQ